MIILNQSNFFRTLIIANFANFQLKTPESAPRALSSVSPPRARGAWLNNNSGIAREMMDWMLQGLHLLHLLTPK